MASLRRSWLSVGAVAGAAVLASMLAAACSTIRPGVEVLEPDVRLTDLALVESGLLEQHFRVTLRVSNPNDFALPLDGLRFALGVNDNPLVTGLTDEAVSVPRLGTATVDVDAFTSTLDVVRQLVMLTQRHDALAYKLDGTVFVTSHGQREMPFTKTGTLQLAPGGGTRFVAPEAGPRPSDVSPAGPATGADLTPMRTPGAAVVDQDAR
jgi:LEA14-like dessication related protein